MTSTLQHGADTRVDDILPPGTVWFDDGTYLTLYQTHKPDYSEYHYYAQHYATDGRAIGDPVLIDGDYPWEGTSYTVAIQTDDGFAIVRGGTRFDPWDTTDYQEGIFLRFFSDGGQTAGPEIVVAEGIKSFPTFTQGGVLTRLDSGNILVSWAQVGNSFEDSLPYIRMYAPDGALLGTVDLSPRGQSVDITAICALSGGGYVVAWSQHDDSGGIQVLIRTFDADNHAVVAPMAIGHASASESIVVVQRLGDGFVLVWDDNGIFRGQVFASDGSHVGDTITLPGTVSPYFQTRIAVLTDGGFVMGWTADGAGDGDGRGVMAQRFDAQGHALGGVVVVNNHIAGAQVLKDLAATDDGGFVVKWQGPGDNGIGTYHNVFSTATNLAGNNLLFGTSGNDSLDGRQGADTMAGGVGNDTYYVDNVGDQVQELAGAGIDLVYSLITYTLTSDVENLTLRGMGDIDGLGNALNNRIAGNAGANHLFGGAGSDDLRALAGNDTLNGNSGADTMLGGAGDDLYYVDNAGDRVIETAAGDGNDTVRASVDYALGAFVENLALVGTENLRGFGNDLNNTITGNAGANILRGLGGSDVINGSAGADSLIGGTGDDTFYVDNIGDKVYESAGEGNDRVYSSVTFAVNSQSIETVILTGSANINAAGGAQAEQLTGNAGANILTGGGGNDMLTGGAGGDTFTFGPASGKDTINDFHVLENDRIDLHGYSLGIANGGGIVISQVGDNTIIDLGGGNTVTVLHTVAADVTSHIIW